MASRDSGTGRAGYTIMELVIVTDIIGLLSRLMAPAVQQARESARRIQCRQHLKELALAIHNYADVNLCLSPSICFERDAHVSAQGAWSIHGRLLPFLDQTAAYQKIRLDLEWNDPINHATGVPQMRIPQIACPSDLHSGSPSYGGPSEGFIFPTNCAFNFGTWKVYDPATNCGGDGCFHPNARISMASMFDGTSQTLCASEVKAFQSYIRNTPDPGPLPPDSPKVVRRHERQQDHVRGGHFAKLSFQTRPCGDDGWISPYRQSID